MKLQDVVAHNREQVKQLLLEGKKSKDVVAEVGCSTVFVSRIAQQLKKENLIGVAVRKQKAVALYQDGLSIKEISQQLNTHEVLIRKQLREEFGKGFESGVKNKVKEEYKQQIIDRFNEENSIYLICHEFNLTPAKAKRIIYGKDNL
jgi:transposase